MMDFPVTYVRRVRFSDSDAQGIVFNGNYLTYFDDTITDYFDALGLKWSDFPGAGIRHGAGPRRHRLPVSRSHR